MKYWTILTAALLAFANPNLSLKGGDAIFSYSLQGTKISGGQVDDLQTSNVASITQTDKGKKIQFFLNDTYNDAADAFPHSLRFAIPGKTGTVTIGPGDDNWNVQLFVAAGADGKYTLYGNDAFTITVSNISATRVSGTFSGKMKGVSGKGETMVITDGKFDVPLRNTGR